MVRYTILWLYYILCSVYKVNWWFSPSPVSNSRESNKSQLFSMETNKKKFYFLYKTFSGISLVQFMVRPRNSNKSVKFGISRNVFLGGFFQNFPNEKKNRTCGDVGMLRHM